MSGSGACAGVTGFSSMTEGSGAWGATGSSGGAISGSCSCCTGAGAGGGGGGGGGAACSGWAGTSGATGTGAGSGVGAGSEAMELSGGRRAGGGEGRSTWALGPAVVIALGP